MWIYDSATHRYRRPSAEEVKEAEQVEIDKIRKMDAAKKATAILEHKKEIRAARVIQRWWRGCLYNPPNGIFYKRAMADFNGIRDTMIIDDVLV